MSNNTISYQTIYSTQIYLNSEFADLKMNGTMNSNVCFFFSNTIQIEKTAIEMRLSVVNAQIPISWYQINSTNNKINITIYSSPNITKSYYITPGNYNVNTFMTQWLIDIGPYFTITFNKNTNCFTFSSSVNSFSFSDDKNSLFNVIGLSTKISYPSKTNDAPVGFTYSLLCPFPVNFAGLTKLHINTNTFNLKNLDSHNKGLDRTIACIPVSSAHNGIIFYNNITNYKNIFKNKEISSIDIIIMDINKNYIDFQNQNWAFTLQIDIINEIIENYDNLKDIYNNQEV